MQELSLNILDIAENSIKAKATLIRISLEENTAEQTLCITIADNGCGMSEDQVRQVMDPFFTTRTTRKVGLGIPFFKMTAEQTGGWFTISSQLGIGTTVKAFYHTGHIDMLPVGDMTATLVSLISVNPQVDFCYLCRRDDREFILDTREIKTLLEGVPLQSPEVLSFLKEFLTEHHEQIKTNQSDDKAV